jgi:PAS domain S-box-containing protein
VEQKEERFDTPSPDAEPGMNLISVDFDIVMVNRTNERLYAKPMVAMLGNKCYQEFEKRDEPCPHCPGRLALQTGVAQEAETTGLRDDGTRFAARIKAHPVIGPDNRATGFIEIVEDITEVKRAERLAAIDGQLQTWLTGIQNVRSALREALRAALLVEGVECGAAFELGNGEGRPNLIQERGLTPVWVETFLEIAQKVSLPGAAIQPYVEQGEGPRPAGFPRVIAVVPIVHHGSPLAALVVGFTVYSFLPASLRTGLQVLGTTTGTAISRILAEQSRGDAIADLEALINVSPLPTWTVDPRGSLTMWNRAAEKVFGWKAGEVVGSVPPWGPAPNVAGSRETVLARKDGRPVEARVSSARFRDVVGNDSARIYIAEDLSAQKRVRELETRLAELEARLTSEGGGEKAPATATEGLDMERVFIVDGDEPWGEELAEVLISLGCVPVRCAAPEEAAEVLAEAGTAAGAATAERPFCVAVVALVGPGGASGLGQRAALRSLGLDVPVILSSDVEVRGHEQHGIAAVIRRPYQAEDVRDALMAALRERAERP